MKSKGLDLFTNSNKKGEGLMMKMIRHGKFSGTLLLNTFFQDEKKWRKTGKKQLGAKKSGGSKWKRVVSHSFGKKFEQFPFPHVTRVFKNRQREKYSTKQVMLLLEVVVMMMMTMALLSLLRQLFLLNRSERWWWWFWFCCLSFHF